MVTSGAGQGRAGISGTRPRARPMDRIMMKLPQDRRLKDIANP